jgi:hypothetical protein
MNSFKNPLTPTITNPVNIDRPIQELQTAIAALGWIEKSFGRAYESRKTNAATKQISVYPQVWQGAGKDLLEVLPNDNLKSYSFFKVEEPIECLQYRQDGHSTMRARVSIIFWFNLKEIDPTIDYSYAELLKGQVQRLLTTFMFTPHSEIKILKTWETVKNVFQGYTIQDAKDQELIYPNGGFRFECELVYLEDCPNSVFDL